MTTRFQSRNRGSFGFKIATFTYTMTDEEGFQSRNRGSFGFKSTRLSSCRSRYPGFNLVIEVLLVSRRGTRGTAGLGIRGFQSRNRGSFGFK